MCDAHMYTPMFNLEFNSRCLPQSLSTLFLEAGSFTGHELTDLARLPGQQVPEILHYLYMLASRAMEWLPQLRDVNDWSLESGAT